MVLGIGKGSYKPVVILTDKFQNKVLFGTQKMSY